MIQLQNVALKFEQRGIAGLSGVSLELKKGEVMAMMGPNGSGKTTLINVLSGQITPESGQVKLEGEARIFTGPEETVDMNVQKFLIAKNKLSIDDEKKLQLARDLADIFEFTFQLRQNLSQLSAGQRQKVALAAELINRPDLILLDEPFTHLDPHTRKDILRALFDYIRNQKISILWVTHELEEALQFSDRVGILNFGKLEQLDAPFELVKQPKNLFVAQFLGYENFLVLNKTSEGWQTPWGNIQGPSTEEAILVLPNESLFISTTGPSAKITRLHLKGLIQKISFTLNDKNFHLSLSIRSEAPKVNSVVMIQAKLDQCFFIPL